MQDSYLRFANTGFGARLTAMLGLPHPLVLERYQPGQHGLSDTRQRAGTVLRLEHQVSRSRAFVAQATGQRPSRVDWGGGVNPAAFAAR